MQQLQSQRAGCVYSKKKQERHTVNSHDRQQTTARRGHASSDPAKFNKALAQSECEVLFLERLEGLLGGGHEQFQGLETEEGAKHRSCANGAGRRIIEVNPVLLYYGRLGCS